MSEQILFEIDKGVARVTLNRPEARNAINADMIARFVDFLGELENRSDIRVILISGSGKHFMAGGDVAGFGKALDAGAAERRAEFEKRVQDCSPWFMALENCPQIVVVKARGWTAGAGIGLVAGADLTIAADNARFICAQINIGTSPDGSTSYHLPRAVGSKRAKEIALLGEDFDAVSAEKWGLINRIVAEEELDGAVEEIVSKLASGPSVALKNTKRLFNLSLQSDLAGQLQHEAESFANSAASGDFIEGIRAFLEKRPAKYTGN